MKRSARTTSAAGASADPTDGSSQLLALLGTAEGDAALAAYVASLHPPGARVSGPDVKRFPPSCARPPIKAIGLSLCYEAGVLDAIHLYADGVDGFTGFRGDAPHGLARRGREEHGEIRGGGAGRAHLQGHGGGFRVRAVRRARRETRPGGGGLGNPRRARAVRVSLVHVATRDARRATPSRVGAWKGSRARVIEKSRTVGDAKRAAANAGQRAEWNDAFYCATSTQNVTRSEPTPARPRRRGRPCSCRWTHIRRAWCGPPRRRLDERVHDPRRRPRRRRRRLFSFLRVLDRLPPPPPPPPPRRGNAYLSRFCWSFCGSFCCAVFVVVPNTQILPGDSAAGAGGASP